MAQDAGVPVISHGGSALADFYASDLDFCAPARFVPVLERFPSLRLVVAHLGHPYYNDLIELAKDFSNVYTDLSFILGQEMITPDDLARVVRDFGVDRVLFGSDFPSCDPAESLSLLESSGLSGAEFDAITSANAGELFFGGSA